MKKWIRHHTQSSGGHVMLSSELLLVTSPLSPVRDRLTGQTLQLPQFQVTTTYYYIHEAILRPQQQLRPEEEKWRGTTEGRWPRTRSPGSDSRSGPGSDSLREDSLQTKNTISCFTLQTRTTDNLIRKTITLGKRGERKGRRQYISDHEYETLQLKLCFLCFPCMRIGDLKNSY